MLTLDLQVIFGSSQIEALFEASCVGEKRTGFGPGAEPWPAVK